MAKTPAAPSPSPAAAAPAPAPTPLPMPASGGCWVRDPVTGELSRDLSEHPEEAPSADQPKE